MRLACIDIGKRFGGVVALANVNLTFGEEGIVAIVGPNGAGKSTLINVITGFIKADSGRCRLGGREITRLPPYKIARLGIARTFQKVRLIQQVSLLENVLLARARTDGDARGAREALRIVRLDDSASKLARELSFGQQRLASLACCIATGASILFLDEPFSGIDPTMIERMITVLGELRTTGRRIVMIEHNLSGVRRVADRVVGMNEGRVFIEGAPSDVLDAPSLVEAYLV